MRILVVNDSYPPMPGGAASVCAEYTDGLRSLGHECLVVVREDADAAGVRRVLRAWNGSRLNWLATGRANAKVIRRIVRDFAPDVAYVHNLFLLTSSVFGACEEEGVPVVAHLHNRDVSLGTKSIPLRVGWGVSPKARPVRVIAVSSSLADWAVEQGMSHSRVHVVLNGLPDAVLTSAAAPAQRRFAHRLMYAGVLSGHKGPDIALDVAIRLGEPWSLDMIGPSESGMGERLRERISESGVGYRCRVLDALSRPETLTMMRDADVVLVPSRWHEPFGLVVLEAMISGAIVVSSDRGALPEVVSDCGFVVPAEDITAMVNAVSRVETMSDEERHSLCVKAYERVRRDFRMSDRVPRVESVLLTAARTRVGSGGCR